MYFICSIYLLLLLIFLTYEIYKYLFVIYYYLIKVEIKKVEVGRKLLIVVIKVRKKYK